MVLFIFCGVLLKIFKIKTVIIIYVLKKSNLSLDQIDYVSFYDKPFLKFERLLETYVANAPKGFNSFRLSKYCS